MSSLSRRPVLSGWAFVEICQHHDSPPRSGGPGPQAGLLCGSSACRAVRGTVCSLFVVATWTTRCTAARGRRTLRARLSCVKPSLGGDPSDIRAGWPSRLMMPRSGEQRRRDQVAARMPPGSRAPGGHGPAAADACGLQSRQLSRRGSGTGSRTAGTERSRSDQALSLFFLSSGLDEAIRRSPRLAVCRQIPDATRACDDGFLRVRHCPGVGLLQVSLRRDYSQRAVGTCYLARLRIDRL